MGRRLSCVVFCSLLFLLQGCGAEQASVPAAATVKSPAIYINYTSSAVQNAAETGLSTFLESLRGGSWSNLGFQSLEELDTARLGTPYRVFAMINAGKPDQNIIDLHEWEFPVMAGDHYRCLLLVCKLGGEWQAVSIGAAELATWLESAEKSHPLLDFKAKGEVKLYDFATTIMMITPSQDQQSFLLLPPVTDNVKNLSQYRNWVNTDPVPVLSFEEIFWIYQGFR